MIAAAEHLPPTELPRFTLSGAFANLAAFRTDRLATLTRVRDEVGDIAAVRIGWIDAVVVSSPAYAQEVLVEHAAQYRKSRGLALFATPLIGNGILASYGEAHRRRRSIVAPAFHHKKIAAYADAIADETSKVIDGWAPDQTVDVSDAALRLTLAVVSRTLFGTTVEGDIQVIDRALTSAMRAMMQLIASPLPLPPSLPTPNGWRMRRGARELRAIVDRIIRERRAALESTGEDRGDVLGMLLSAKDEVTGQGLTDRELCDEAITLFLAGHETTANALTWAWHLLARHPAAQARLSAEAREVLGDGRAPTFADLPRLPYALAVFKESMRLYPPAYFLGRRALGETRIGPHRIEPGRTVFINVWGIHRSPQVFDAPDDFRPERFLDGADKAWPRGAYLPFGGGPRICVGNAFALMEGQMALAQVASRFRLEVLRNPADGVMRNPADGVGAGAPMPGAEPLITLRPAGELAMVVRGA